MAEEKDTTSVNLTITNPEARIRQLERQRSQLEESLLKLQEQMNEQMASVIEQIFQINIQIRQLSETVSIEQVVNSLTVTNKDRELLLQLASQFNLDRKGVAELVEMKIAYATTFRTMLTLARDGHDLQTIGMVLAVRENLRYPKYAPSLNHISRLYQRFPDIPADADYITEMIIELCKKFEREFPDIAIKMAIEIAQKFELVTLDAVLEHFDEHHIDYKDEIPEVTDEDE